MFTFSFVFVQPVLHGNKRRRLSANAQPGFWPTFRGMTHYYDKLSKMCYRITDHVLNTIASKWSIIIIYLLQCESYGTSGYGLWQYRGYCFTTAL